MLIIKSRQFHIYSIIFIVLSILRIQKSFKMEPVFGDYDSASYFSFSLFGGLRMPLITFIYSNIQNLNSIVLFQSVISLLTFFYFGAVLFTFNLNRNITLLFSILTLCLGNSNHVVYLDSTIDSESLNISFLVLLIGSIILFFQFNNLILDRKSTRLNSSHVSESRMPSSA